MHSGKWRQKQGIQVKQPDDIVNCIISYYTRLTGQCLSCYLANLYISMENILNKRHIIDIPVDDVLISTNCNSALITVNDFQ